MAKMEIQKIGKKWVIPCREWANVHLGMEGLTYEYSSKRNAQRAATDPKRSQTTNLCAYAQAVYERVCLLETLLLGIKQTTNSYDFDEPDAGSWSDSGDAVSGCEGAAGDDTDVGGSAEGATGANCSTD